MDEESSDTPAARLAARLDASDAKRRSVAASDLKSRSGAQKTKEKAAAEEGHGHGHSHGADVETEKDN